MKQSIFQRINIPLGDIYVTTNAQAKLTTARILSAISRHQSGDWGDLDASDHAANNAALKDGSRLLSSYALHKGDKVWVLTEAVGEDGESRASTCLLLPSDY